MRGRPRKPIPIRAAEGDTQKKGSRKHAAIMEAALEAKRGMPECPPGMDPVAKRHWQYLADGLHREGLLAEIDGGSLVTAATAYSAMIATHKAKDYVAWEKASGRYMQIADRLGLHESARAKFTKKQTTGDAIADAMCG